ncbi:MAG: Stp1/IreP family PP2C-type Ser/Thr phosphatase [Clostridia bacterium]|nr:Stp1/IreP family PP2C-type Ser/Thr phosphatase [Clostridia bacterium]MBP3650488.1 Stp1/IreP family PP2C-type Ser/Thr phosphatase [Clostridia bacterium]
MRVCHRTHQGLVRANNQDNWLAQAPLYGVADGMGGHKGGETASRVALQVFQNAIGQKKPDAATLRMAVEAANRRVYDMSAHDESLSGMGTTMSMIWQDEDRLLIAHVGDSRIYRLREGKLQQITDDHSFVAELVRNNIITPEMARNHPQRNIITRAVGVDPFVEVDVLEQQQMPGDLWLICSDGLHGMVEDDEIQSILSEMELEEAAERLISRALENGGHDNVTFVLLSNTEVTAE